jgi:hypothetical protein
MPAPSKLRLKRGTSAAASASTAPAVTSGLSRLERLSFVATVVAAPISMLALVASLWQFGESFKLQMRSEQLQRASVQADRSAKAADLYERYINLRFEKYDFVDRKKLEDQLFERHNKSLVLLNSIFAITAGDDAWRDLVHWSLDNHWHYLHKGNTMCLWLTDDFRRYLGARYPDDKNYCRDVSESN